MKLFVFLYISLLGVLLLTLQLLTVSAEEHGQNVSTENVDFLVQTINNFSSVEHENLLKLESFLNIINTKDIEYHKLRARRIRERVEKSQFVTGNESVCWAMRNHLQESFLDSDSNSLERISNNFTEKSDEISILMELIKKTKMHLSDLTVSEPSTKDERLKNYIYEKTQKKKLELLRLTTKIAASYFKNINANIDLSNRIETSMIEQLNRSCGSNDLATAVAATWGLMSLSVQSSLKKKGLQILTQTIEGINNSTLSFIASHNDQTDYFNYWLNKTEKQVSYIHARARNGSKEATDNATLIHIYSNATELASGCLYQFTNASENRIKSLYQHKENLLSFIENELASKGILEWEKFPDFAVRVEYELNRKDKFQQFQSQLKYYDCLINIINTMENENYARETVVEKYQE